MTPEATYESIVAAFAHKEEIAPGKMMSSPALKYKGKVFAFFYKESMGFKLGKDFQPDSMGLNEWELLSPFKNKPPMKAWFIVPFSESGRWQELCTMALEKMR